MGILSFLGALVDPTDEYKSYSHKVFSQCLVWVITLVVGHVTTLGFIGVGLLTTGWIFDIFHLSTVINSWILIVLALWSLIEVGFYFYCLHLKRKLDAPMEIQILSPAEKAYFLDKVLDDCEDPWAALVRWFHVHSPADVGLECFEVWLSWAYFGKLVQDLNDEEKEECDFLVGKVIRKCPQIARSSNLTELKFMKLHLDEVAVQHKPFIAYVVISGMQALGSLFLSRLGFEHRTLPGQSGLSYWTYGTQYLKPDTRPIFFVHGIGIGIAMYFNVVKWTVAAFSKRPIFILEVPNISLKIMDRIPSIEETLEGVDHIFATHKIKSCSWLAHSYGTIVTTWILKERPSYVQKITYVDPVCFALWEPDLIYNFLYKHPPTAITRLQQFFVAQDLLVASTLFRNFSWLDNILFPGDIHCPAQVFISSHDFIIDPKLIHKYLDTYNRRVEREGVGRRVGLHLMHGLSHGSILNSPKHVTQVLKHV